MVRVKIIQAMVDSNVDSFVENQIERWLVTSPSERIIQRIDTAITIKEILIFITFTEEWRTLEKYTEHVDYLMGKEGKRIFGRNLDIEELKDWGFNV